MPGRGRPGRLRAVPEGLPYRVRLSVARRRGWREWAAVSAGFERRLAEQSGPGLGDPHVESQTRRGRDYVGVTLLMTITAPDVAAALAVGWGVFLQAAGGDTEGWDMGSASAEVRPA